MTLDKERISQKIEAIERLLEDWEGSSDQITLAALKKDRKTCLFLCYVMESAIQIALDLSNHLIANFGLPKPGSYRESFRTLGREGWISGALAKQLEELAGFRNILAPHYPDLDYSKMLPHARNSWKTIRVFARTVARKTLKKRRRATRRTGR